VARITITPWILRLSQASLTVLSLVGAPPAFAQTLQTPGPGGIPLAPGAPVSTYTPGGMGPGGVHVAPGPAAADIPMYRLAPDGLRMLVPPNPQSSTGSFR
jgi:hypothetical protein